MNSNKGLVEVAFRYASIVLGSWWGKSLPSQTCIAVLRGCTAT